MKIDEELIEELEEEDNGNNTKKKMVISFIVALAINVLIGVAFGLILYFASYRGTSKTALQYWADVISVTGTIGVSMWLFALVTSFGAFDMIVYGTKKMFFAIFRRNPRSGLPRTYLEYVESKKDKRTNRYWPFLIISLCILFAGVILLITYYSI